MHLHPPSLVLIPDTFVSQLEASVASGGKKLSTTSLLVQCIIEEFDSCPVEPVARKYWSETAGIYEYLAGLNVCYSLICRT